MALPEPTLIMPSAGNVGLPVPKSLPDPDVEPTNSTGTPMLMQSPPPVEDAPLTTYSVIETADDDATWFTEMLASLDKTTKGKIAVYNQARSESGFFGDIPEEESREFYFTAPDGRIAFKSPDQTIRYEQSKGVFPWLKEFSASLAPETLTTVAETVVTGMRGTPKIAAVTFVVSHLLNEWGKRNLLDANTPEDVPSVLSLDGAISTGKNMVSGLAGIGVPAGIGKVREGLISGTGLDPIPGRLGENIEANQEFFYGKTGVDLPLDAAADRKSRTMTNVGAFLRQQPQSSDLFDVVDDEIKGVMSKQLDEARLNFPAKGLDPLVIGDRLQTASKGLNTRLLSARQEAVEKIYNQAHRLPANSADVADLIAKLERQVADLDADYARPIIGKIKQLKIKNTEGEADVVTNSKLLHSMRQSLDDLINEGKGNISALVIARKSFDNVLKKIPGFQAADAKFQDMTNWIMNELGAFVQMLVKKPDSTNYVKVVNEIFSSNVTPAMVRAARKTFNANDEFSGLWDELISLKFSKAVEQALKNETAETGGMNVWKKLANNLDSQSPTGKVMRAALDDDPVRLAKFEDFVRLTRLAGAASGQSSQTQIFSSFKEVLAQKGEFSVYSLTGIGS